MLFLIQFITDIKKKTNKNRCPVDGYYYSTNLVDHLFINIKDKVRGKKNQ